MKKLVYSLQQRPLEWIIQVVTQRDLAACCCGLVTILRAVFPWNLSTGSASHGLHTSSMRPLRQDVPRKACLELSSLGQINRPLAPRRSRSLNSIQAVSAGWWGFGKIVPKYVGVKIFCLTSIAMISCKSIPVSTVTMSKRAFQIRGRVVDIVNEPVEQMMVRLVLKPYQEAVEVMSTVTNRDGYYEFYSDYSGKDLVPGSYMISAGEVRSPPSQKIIVFEGKALELKEPIQVVKAYGASLLPMGLPPAKELQDGLMRPQMPPVHGY